MTWTGHRVRAAQLSERYPFAAEVLGCYSALLEVWDTVQPPTVDNLVGWARGDVAPLVLAATEAAGPEKLAVAIQDVPVEAVCAAWLAGENLPPVERYLAIACLYPGLVVLGDEAGRACRDDPAPRDERHCPRCGGQPQLSVRRASGDQLVSGSRQLVCVRCGHTWSFSGSTCPSCGETSGGKRTLYAEHSSGPVVGPHAPAGNTEPATFPHLRIEACAACERYLIDVDLARDIRAVPVVDELAALPLALYAADQGLTKIAPNLMGL
jgi:FdhE protein